MVNTKNFTERLEKIMKYYDLSAASFADKIEVGRSSISHLLSGRNKPSLDFVMKIVKSFPEVELYWLLNGKGTFPSSHQKPGKSNPLTIPEDLNPGLSSEKNDRPEKTDKIQPGASKDIQRIVIFYKDGTFDAFEN
ncbi:helix-turn-helix transcriptional regulator [Gramella sp. AN32]|uniref:Helix-turn-helix domain-containing protein n=1 Tax=Christiangramia antarctica TaxID=2058158 RepID=A0ABW5XA16_9FLAO|nr:helix-turn-helix transcriptional regulator [Gramella sp. AN32]MCM4157406.1 transcriptional regulator [Gramella sp. AN32]